MEKKIKSESIGDLIENFGRYSYFMQDTIKGNPNKFKELAGKYSSFSTLGYVFHPNTTTSGYYTKHTEITPFYVNKHEEPIAKVDFSKENSEDTVSFGKAIKYNSKP